MHPLNAYLAHYFLNGAQLAAASGLSCAQQDDLLSRSLIPAPSYVVKSSRIRSAVFGELPAPGAVDGQYFQRHTVTWVRRAVECRSRLSWELAYEELKTRFKENLGAALADLDRSVWRLRDCFRDDGSITDKGLAARCESTWQHFQNGTYGICVACPTSELAIARKDVLQEKLIALTAKASHARFSPTERHVIEQTIDEYAEVCAPFSPVDYPLSSRKRLVDDLRNSLQRARELDDPLADFPLVEGCEAQ